MGAHSVVFSHSTWFDFFLSVHRPLHSSWLWLLWVHKGWGISCLLHNKTCTSFWVLHSNAVVHTHHRKCLDGFYRCGINSAMSDAISHLSSKFTRGILLLPQEIKIHITIHCFLRNALYITDRSILSVVAIQYLTQESSCWHYFQLSHPHLCFAAKLPFLNINEIPALQTTHTWPQTKPTAQQTIDRSKVTVKQQPTNHCNF